MNSISQVQQDLLGRMEQLKNLGEAAPIKPAQAFAGQTGEAGFAAAFDDAVRAVDAQPVSYTHLDVYKRQITSWG